MREAARERILCLIRPTTNQVRGNDGDSGRISQRYELLLLSNHLKRCDTAPTGVSGKPIPTAWAWEKRSCVGDQPAGDEPNALSLVWETLIRNGSTLPPSPMTSTPHTRCSPLAHRTVLAMWTATCTNAVNCLYKTLHDGVISLSVQMDTMMVLGNSAVFLRASIVIYGKVCSILQAQHRDRSSRLREGSKSESAARRHASARGPIGRETSSGLT